MDLILDNDMKLLIFLGMIIRMFHYAAQWPYS